MRSSRNEAPIFVGGTGRCGTTTLTRLLGWHSQIFSLTWESQLIVSEGGLIDVLRSDFDPELLERFIERLRGPWFRRTVTPQLEDEYEAGLSADIDLAHVESALALLRDASEKPNPPEEVFSIGREFIQTLFDEAARRAGAQRWCEKTPVNILCAEELWRMFPNMKLVHILRDGRDVVASMREKKFWPIGASSRFPTLGAFTGEITVEKACDYWVEVLRLARIQSSRIPPENYLELRLEDLVDDSTACLQRVCLFLGEEVEPRMQNFDLSGANRSRWATDFSANEIALINERLRPTLLMEGYD